jgi:hypothetical protein
MDKKSMSPGIAHKLELHRGHRDIFVSGSAGRRMDQGSKPGSGHESAPLGARLFGVFCRCWPTTVFEKGGCPVVGIEIHESSTPPSPDGLGVGHAYLNIGTPER